MDNVHEILGFCLGEQTHNYPSITFASCNFPDFLACSKPTKPMGNQQDRTDQVLSRHHLVHKSCVYCASAPVGFTAKCALSPDLSQFGSVFSCHLSPHFTSELVPFPVVLGFLVLQSWLIEEKWNPHSLAAALVLPSPPQHLAGPWGFQGHFHLTVLRCFIITESANAGSGSPGSKSKSGYFCAQFSTFFPCSWHPPLYESMFSPLSMPTRW